MKWRDQMSGETFEFKLMPVEALRVSPYQRDLSKGLVSSLVGSIAKGFVVPLVVTRAGLVVDGQHRLEAVKQLGVKEVPCVVVPDVFVDRPLMFNVEKADSVRDKAIKAYRYYVSHMDETEDAIADGVEEWHYVTLGFALMLGLRAPGLVEGAVAKLDRCLGLLVRDGATVRTGWAKLVCDFEQVVEEATKGQKYEAKMLVVRTVLGRVHRVSMDFVEGMQTMINEVGVREWTWSNS